MTFLSIIEQYPIFTAAFFGFAFGTVSQLLLNWFTHRNAGKREKLSERRRGRFEFYKSLSNRLIDLITNPKQGLNNINEYIKIFNEMHICASGVTIKAVRELIDMMLDESRKQHTLGRDLLNLAIESIEAGWDVEKTTNAIQSNIEMKFSVDHSFFQAEAAYANLTLEEYDYTSSVCEIASILANLAHKIVALEVKSKNIDAWLKEAKQDIKSKIIELQKSEAQNEMQQHYNSSLVDILNDSYTVFEYQARANHQLKKIYLEMRKDVGLPDDDNDRTFSLQFVKLSPSEIDWAKREARNLFADLLKNRTKRYFFVNINTDLTKNTWSAKVLAFREDLLFRSGLNSRIVKIPNLLIDLAKVFDLNSGDIDSDAESLICKIHESISDEA
ncbi:hypothetical protein LJB99_06655 [Deltaproteobacteria bacterium OttesenSCG-928-K17]|nr:hypothetical protein [Deltaproteobacteria bacterium OttesenSCG-928-K17]